MPAAPDSARVCGRPTVAAGLVLGYLADRLLADPSRWHPVAGFGRIAQVTEGHLYSDSRTAGATFTTVLVGGATGAAYLLGRRLPPAAEVVATAIATWAVLGGTSLLAVATAVADDLDNDDLDGARGHIRSLCARDPEMLDAAGVCRAALESVAENTSDATIGPLVWGAIGGIPGLVGYRAVNTLDAMVGYRSPRYGRFGWASARLDDAANLIPARFTAGLTVVLGGSPRAAIAAWRADASGHPSPNAGVVEASMAGALGVGLGGPTVYAHGVEQRPTLGVGHAPQSVDLRAALALSRRTQTAAVVVVAGVPLAGHLVRRWANRR